MSKSGVAGDEKKKIEGGSPLQEQTQYSYFGDGDMAVWAHPINFCFTSNTLLGWPRLLLEIFKLDSYGREDTAGYGVLTLPKFAGAHELECTTWRPCGTRQQAISGELCLLVCCI